MSISFDTLALAKKYSKETIENSGNSVSNVVSVWEGAIPCGGYADFYVPKECWHNNYNTLTLMVDSVIESQIENDKILIDENYLGELSSTKTVIVQFTTSYQIRKNSDSDTVYFPRIYENNSFSTAYEPFVNSTGSYTNFISRCQKIATPQYSKVKIENRGWSAISIVNIYAIVPH